MGISYYGAFGEHSNGISDIYLVETVQIMKLPTELVMLVIQRQRSGMKVFAEAN